MRLLMAAANRPMAVRRRRTPATMAGKTIVVTGASSGVGRATALRLGREGASVVLVARREPELRATRDAIIAAGGRAELRVCDLADEGQVDDLGHWLHDRWPVDVLVNNAGRSMRRPLDQVVLRLDDLHRAMAVNYLGPARLTLLLVPGMTKRRDGQIVNVGTWTVPVGTSPRYAAYHASKAALDGFGRSLGAELAREGVHVTSVHFPLVHTPMSAPTARFKDLPGLTPEEAAGWIVMAIRQRPRAIVPRFVPPARLVASAAPRAAEALLLRFG
jgi:NAD(P)-dependent dehydrogenase (short-subunit alcohol dehydrogenase family)